MKFQWMNESRMSQDGERIEIYAPKQTDFFCNSFPDGTSAEPVCSAPFYYTNLSGDFVLQVKVSLEFKDTYDSACVMIMKDCTNWAKACFELTDFGKPSVVSVVTKGVSDDANGCIVDSPAVWLKVCRCGQTFSFHYSEDGDNFYMMRFFNMPCGDEIKVGLVAQAPVGNGGMRIFENLSIEHKTVENIRKGQ